MTVEQWVAVFSALVSFAGWLLVVAQLKQGNDQRRLDSLLHIKEINREILSLGFDNPRLFPLLQGRKTADSTQEQHYLQLWFNQFELIHSFCEQGMFSQELAASLERDIGQFVSLDNVRQHWRRKRQFYTPSFQAFIDSLAEGKADAPRERPPRKRRFKRP